MTAEELANKIRKVRSEKKEYSDKYKKAKRKVNTQEDVSSALNHAGVGGILAGAATSASGKVKGKTSLAIGGAGLAATVAASLLKRKAEKNKSKALGEYINSNMDNSNKRYKLTEGSDLKRKDVDLANRMSRYKTNDTFRSL